MSLKLPSGGRLSLAMKCIGSVLLPQVVEEIGEQAEKGLSDHAKLEKFFKGSRKEPEGSTDADRDLFARVVKTISAVENIGSCGEWAELGCAVDAISGSESNYIRTASSGDEGYVDRSKSFVGIADLIQRTGESSFAVWDWKSGGYVPSPEWNFQLVLSGLYLYLLCGARDSRSPFNCSLGIVYTGQPTDDGKFKSDVKTFDGAWFEKQLDRLSFLQRRLESGSESLESVTLYEGKHCFFCPAAARCPAKIGALGMAIAGLGMDLNDRSIVQNYLAVKDAWSSKYAMDALERNGNVLDLGDGREAVLTKTGNKRKVFTRRSSEQKARPNASEDGESGAEGGGDSSP